MLKLKYLYENYPLAKLALTHWDHDEEGLDQILSRFRISSNAVYPFCRRGETCFLRLAPAGEKLEKNLLGEMEFLCYLQDQGYPALRPLPSKEGELCLTLDTPWGPYYAAAFPHVGGASLEDTPLTPQVLFAYGQALGRLHALSARFVPQVRKWDYREALDWTAQVIKEYGAPGAMAAQVDLLRKELGELPATPEAYGLVHYDFELDNVFYHTDTHTCWAIDFEDGMYHWYALDIWQVFDSLEDTLGEGDLPAAREEFLRGYRTQRPTPPDLEALLPRMGRFVNLYGYARLIRCVAEKGEDEPGWMAELREKLARAIAAREKSLLGA